MSAYFVCVGNVTFDKLYWVDRLPVLDDVATVRGEADCIGGRGAIVAALCARLGIPVSLITTLPDAVSTQAERFLNEYGASGRLIGYRAGAAPSRVTAIIGREEQNCISLFHPGLTNPDPAPDQVSAVRAASLAYFTTHDIQANIKLLAAVADSTRVIINMTAYMMRNQAYLAHCTKRAHVLIGNEAELSAFLTATGCRQASGLFDRLPRLERAFVTLGARGVEVFSSGRDRFRLPALAAEVKTPLGVGDAFAAGVCYGEYLNLPPDRSADIGLRLAALSIASSATCPPAQDIDHLAIQPLKGTP